MGCFMKEGLIYVEAWTMAGQDSIRANSQPIGSPIVIAEDIIFLQTCAFSTTVVLRETR